MALPTAIAVNQTAGNLTITDLGLVVPASSQITLTNFVDFWEISGSDDLEALINSDDVLMNDGTSTLTKSESLAFLDITGNVNGPISSPAQNQIAVYSDTTGRFLSNSTITISSANISGANSLIFTEAAAAPTVSTGQGAIWTKDDTPSSLFFTDDASTDHEIALKSSTNFQQRIVIPPVGNQTINEYGWAIDGMKLVNAQVYSHVAASIGSYTLALTKDPAGTADNMLSTTTFNMASLGSATPTAVTLSGTASNLELSAGTIWRAQFVSNNINLDAEGVYLILNWQLT